MQAKKITPFSKNHASLQFISQKLQTKHQIDMQSKYNYMQDSTITCIA